MGTDKKLIMTVDDDEGVRVTIRLALEMAGFDVIEATEGQEALTKLRDVRGCLPSAILTDWNMPNGMGGEAFLEAMTYDSRFAGIPVVVISGTADNAALKMGAARVLGKPFALDALLVAIEFACSGINAPRSPTSASMRQILTPVAVGGGG